MITALSGTLEGIGTLGDLVRHVRISRHWSQTQLAMLVRCRQVQISDIELNRYCAAEVIERVLNELSISLPEEDKGSEDTAD